MKNITENSNKAILGVFGAVAILIIIIAAAAASNPKTDKNSNISGSRVRPITDKNSEAEADEIKLVGIFTYNDDSGKKMRFVEADSGQEYEAVYSGGTDIQNKYGSVIAASQMNVGSIYNITCNKNGKAILIYESSDVWEYSGITNFAVNESSQVMTIGDTNYKYSSNTLIVSNGEKIGVSQIIDHDVITARGYGNNVYSIMVEKGHGYVKFTGYDGFLGGYADIGTKLVVTVTKDMMITAPEGTYTIMMQKGDLQGAKTVVIERDKSIEVDFSEFQEEPVQMGSVEFSVLPEDALLYIDGKQVDYSMAIPLEYGKHTLLLRASGYQTYTEILIIDTNYITKKLDLSQKTTESKTAAADLTSGYVVNITAPEGAAAYVDSVYIGVIGKEPASFAKSAGRRVITLTKAGCETISYTINIENTSGDMTYSFPEMELRTVGATPQTAVE